MGIDQSEEYVSYARKRLEHALEHAAHAADEAKKLQIITDAKRVSKVMTATDAFGRPRVARKRAAKSA